ncbi:helix-turn-helix domain-containing protein [Streptomyces sp. NPDC057020]|uniref:helix-turn-helix domain-containing protein n=1 Tax=unclassified Streptomyces TaxID=2593676 RepID=UPI0036251738
MSTTATGPRLAHRYRGRLNGEARVAKAGALAERYLAGASIRAVADWADLSYGTARQLLLEAGVKLRGRGGSRAGGSK